MRKYAIRGGLLVLAFGLTYGGLDLAGAAPGGTPGPPAQTVTVGNGVADPVPVQQQGAATVTVSNTVRTAAADNPAFQAVNTSVHLSASPGGALDFDATIYTVPSGKELVITELSADVLSDVTLLPYATFNTFSQSADPANESGLTFWDLPLQANGSQGGSQFASHSGLQQAQIYVSPGVAVTCGFLQSTSGTTQGRCSLSGYLVNLP